ncbi:MAG: nucleotidyltransferase family protein [Ardenticatenaceae bacterium]|nr:nucleotidyltransferase family protein [Ardenticatenaceae bacterium]MCB8987627.1 nucleotidyltransferase family protein [Ardenticatenaceae bacterium]
MTSVDGLLLACTHLPHKNDEPLTQALAAFSAWDELLPAAEAQGLGPLLYAHVRNTAVTVPDEIRLGLQGMFVRARHWHNVAETVVAQALAAAQQADIPLVVLKGLALASVVYPEAALRPMRDVDLLVNPADEPRLRQILADCGFAPLVSGPIPPDHRHGVGLARTVEGTVIHLELHHNLFSGFMAGDSLTLADVAAWLRPFRLGRQEALTLDHEVMLWHLYRHMIVEPWRLIRVVDLVAYAEKFSGRMDWARLRRRHPLVLQALALLHGMTPLSAQLQARAGINPAFTLALKEIPQDWPPLGDAHWAEMKRWQQARGLFFPQPASLCLYYGISSAGELARMRWLRHPLQVLLWIGRRVVWRQSRS